MESTAHNIAKTFIAVFISVCIALVPLDIRANPPYTACLSSELNTQLSGVNIQKNEAQAMIPVVAGGAAAVAAEAATLGISSEALMAGLVALLAAGTGVYMLESSDGMSYLTDLQWGRLWNDPNISNPGYEQNWEDEYQNWSNPANGNRSWDDLTSEEKAAWGSPANYVQAGFVGLALNFPELFQLNGNGEPEPTPEPDPENDPQGHEKWTKARNVLIALGAGMGGVALSDAVNFLADSAAGTVRDLLFGKPFESNGDKSFSLNYTGNITNSGITVPVMSVGDITAYSYANPPVSRLMRSAYCVNVTYDTSNGGYYNWRYFKESDGVSTVILATTRYGYFTATTATSLQYTNYYLNGTNGSNIGVRGPQASGTSITIGSPSGSTAQNYLNLDFAGTYQFPDGATITNGVMDGVTIANPYYGQLSDTPNGLAEAIPNTVNYNNFINNYTNDTGQQDYKRAVTIPSNLLGGDGNGTVQNSYQDFVSVTPESGIVTIPGGELINPPDNPDTPTTQFQQDFGERVGELLAQPFDQLFPFCLIGDLRRLTGMIEDAVYGQDGELSAQDVTVINGTEKFVIPLSGFGDFFDDIEFEIDLTPVTDLAAIIRPFFTALFIVGLLVGTFRFFLNRGGE